MSELCKEEQMILFIIEQQKERIKIKFGEWCSDNANYGWFIDTDKSVVITKIYRQNDYPVFVHSQNTEMGTGGMIINEWYDYRPKEEEQKGGE